MADAAASKNRQTVKGIIYKIVQDIFIGHKMMYWAFELLYQKLADGIISAMSCAYPPIKGGRQGFHTPSPIPNGTIATYIQLPCTLQNFCGAVLYDLMIKYQISHQQVLNSVWFVVNAVNKCKEFDIEYLADKVMQQQVT